MNLSEKGKYVMSLEKNSKNRKLEEMHLKERTTNQFMERKRELTREHLPRFMEPSHCPSTIKLISLKGAPHVLLRGSLDDIESIGQNWYNLF